MSWPTLFRQAMFVVDEGNTRRRCIAPFPEHEIQIFLGRSRRETPDEQRVIAVCDQPPGERLRPGLSARFHLVAPRGVGEHRRIHSSWFKGSFVPAIEDTLDLG